MTIIGKSSVPNNKKVYPAGSPYRSGSTNTSWLKDREDHCVLQEDHWQARSLSAENAQFPWPGRHRIHPISRSAISQNGTSANIRLSAVNQQPFECIYRRQFWESLPDSLPICRYKQRFLIWIKPLQIGY